MNNWSRKYNNLVYIQAKPLSLVSTASKLKLKILTAKHMRLRKKVIKSLFLIENRTTEGRNVLNFQDVNGFKLTKLFY